MSTERNPSSPWRKRAGRTRKPNLNSSQWKKKGMVSLGYCGIKITLFTAHAPSSHAPCCAPVLYTCTWHCCRLSVCPFSNEQNFRVANYGKSIFWHEWGQILWRSDCHGWKDLAELGRKWSASYGRHLKSSTITLVKTNVNWVLCFTQILWTLSQPSPPKHAG